MANSKWQNWKPMETSTCVMNACRNGGQAQPKLNRNSNAMPIEKAIAATKTFCVCNQALHFRLFRGRGNARGWAGVARLRPKKPKQTKLRIRNARGFLMSRLPFLFIASAKANCMHKYLIFLFTHKYVCACARRPQFPHFTLANFCEVINKTFKKR